MSLPVHRSAALALALAVVGCTATRRFDPPTVIKPDGGTGRHKVVGATLKNGREMRFDATPVVRADTLRATVAKQATIIPVADLREVWVESMDVKKTSLVLVGLAAGFLAVAALAVQSIDYGPWPTN